MAIARSAYPVPASWKTVMRPIGLSLAFFNDQVLVDLAAESGHYDHSYLFTELWALTDDQGRIPDSLIADADDYRRHLVKELVAHRIIEVVDDFLRIPQGHGLAREREAR